jgi:hypothetical protein
MPHLELKDSTARLPRPRKLSRLTKRSEGPDRLILKQPNIFPARARGAPSESHPLQRDDVEVSRMGSGFLTEVGHVQIVPRLLGFTSGIPGVLARNIRDPLVVVVVLSNAQGGSRRCKESPLGMDSVIGARVYV